MFYDVDGTREQLLNYAKPISIGDFELPLVIAHDYNWSNVVYLIDYEKVFQSYTRNEIVYLFYRCSLIPKRYSMSENVNEFRYKVLNRANLIQNSRIVEKHYMDNKNKQFVNRNTNFLMQIKNEVEQYKTLKELNVF